MRFSIVSCSFRLRSEALNNQTKSSDVSSFEFTFHFANLYSISIIITTPYSVKLQLQLLPKRVNWMNVAFFFIKSRNSVKHLNIIMD